MSEEHQQPAHDRIAEHLREELASDLRGVLYLSPETETIAYMRDDVREQYTSEEIREIFHEILLEGIDHGRCERLLDSEFEATAQIFENQVVTVFTIDVQEGIIVSLEREGDYSYLDVLSECQQLIER